MGYKFKCENCGEEIVSKYCFVGEIVRCKVCETKNVIPQNAEKVGEEPQFVSKPVTTSGMNEPKQKVILIPQTDIGPWHFLTLLGELFRIYGKNFLKLIGIALIMLVLMFLTMIPLIIAAVYLPVVKKYLPIFFGVYYVLVSVVLMSFSHCALVYAIAKQYVTRTIGVGDAYRYAINRLGVAIRANALRLLVFFALTITIIGIPYAIYLFFSWSFIYHTIVIEGLRDSRKAMRRSEELIEGYWWRTFGMIFIFSAIATIINFPFRTILFGAIISSVLTIPIMVIGVELLYFDLRVRKEGYTLEKLAEELGFNVSQSSKK